MLLGQFLKYLQKFPLKVIIQKVISSTKAALISKRIGTWSEKEYRSCEKKCHFCIDVLPRIHTLQVHGKLTEYTKLNILGATPSNLLYNEIQPGFEGIQYNHNLEISEFDAEGKWLKRVVRDSHLDFSKKTWLLIQSIDPTYSPIDWQKDIKTGFRWDAKTLATKQGKLMKGSPGVDIKNPWEVSRLQHLPIISLSLQNSSQDKITSFNTVICHLLDFVMANPIGMGVNFSCPMDIGIRNANILLSLCLLKSSNLHDKLNPEVESTITSYVAASTTYILQNLEYRTGLTSNHYLGNIMGVLFAGSILKDHPNANQWLLFGIQEIENCMARQFFDDGSNFEGSTSYHRLSAEMMSWAALLTIKIPKERLNQLQELNLKNWKYRPKIDKKTIQNISDNSYVYSDSFWKKLVLSKSFTESITKNNGDVFQFGDNDSGRFIALTNIGQALTKKEAVQKYKNLNPDFLADDEMYWDESSLNHGALVSSLSGLIQADLPETSGCQAEYEIFKSTFQDVEGFNTYISQFCQPEEALEVNGDLQKLEHFQEKTFSFDDKGVDLTKKNSFCYHPDFQLVIVSNQDFNLALAGISNPKQHHSLGHTHNDKLAVELQVKGDDVLYNPGTYVYSPNKAERFKFRSVQSHNTCSVNGMEQNRPLSGHFGLFNLEIETKFKLIKLTSTEIIAEVDL